MEVPESTKRHTLKQIEQVLFTLCDGSFVFCDVTSEISDHVMVRRQITRVGSAKLLESAYLWDTP